MLDDFQENDETASFLDEIDGFGLEDIDDDNVAVVPKSLKKSGKILGMSPAQRLLISILLLLLTCTLASLCLLVFEKITPPF